MVRGGREWREREGMEGEEGNDGEWREGMVRGENGEERNGMMVRGGRGKMEGGNGKMRRASLECEGGVKRTTPIH